MSVQSLYDRKISLPFSFAVQLLLNCKAYGVDVQDIVLDCKHESMSMRVVGIHGNVVKLNSFINQSINEQARQ